MRSILCFGTGKNADMSHKRTLKHRATKQAKKKPTPFYSPTQTVAVTCFPKYLRHSTSLSSEQHGAAPGLNEKQFEEAGNNPRQAPAGCHKTRGCLSSFSPHVFSFNSMGWWKINGPAGQPLSGLLSATAPGSEPITKHNEGGGVVGGSKEKTLKSLWMQTERLGRLFCVCVRVYTCVFMLSRFF